MTRDEILSLKVGDIIERTYDLIPFSGLKAKPDARYTFKGAVTEVSFRGYNVNGKAYVGGYTQFGHNATMSFSCTEGEEIIRFAPNPNPRMNSSK